MVRRIAILAPLVAAGLAAGVAASAPGGGGPPRQTSQNSPALRAVEADQAGRERDLASALADADQARAELAQLEAQLAELNSAQANGEHGVSDRRLQLAALNVQERELDARLGGDQARLARLLGALEMFRRDPPPALFVKPTDVRDAVRAAILIRAITPELERRAQTLKAQASALQLVRRRIDTSSADLLVRESDVAERRAKIETLIAQKTALQGRADAEAEAARQDIEALAARARALRELTVGVAAAPAPAAAGEPPDPEHAGLFGHAKPFTEPTAGAPIRRFGELEPGGRSRSDGWTWRTAANAQVLAPAQGVVEYAGPLKGWGLVLILRLGGGYHLVLAGLESALIAPGRMVAAGQPVGRMGNDGQTDSDLYFEIRKNGAPVDPARWLKAPSGPAGRR
jgi:septal ring factor EnvC (AmiA/AmiB activator)